MSTVAIIPARGGLGGLDAAPTSHVPDGHDCGMGDTKHTSQQTSRRRARANDDDLFGCQLRQVMVFSATQPDKSQPIGMLHVLACRAVFQIGNGIVRGVAVLVVDLLSGWSGRDEGGGNDTVNARRQLPTVMTQGHVEAPLPVGALFEHPPRPRGFARGNTPDESSIRDFVDAFVVHDWSPFHAEIIPCA